MFDDVRVIEESKNLDLSLDFFEYPLLLDLLFVHDLNRHFVTTNLVESHYRRLVRVYLTQKNLTLNLAKRTSTEVL